MKINSLKRHFPSIVLVLIALVMFQITSNINWGKDHWNQIVRSDGEGNYAYLPAAFIYHDFNFGFFDYYEGIKYHDEFNYRDYRMEVEGHRINKSWSGMAFATSPFYLAAHLYAGLSGYDQDGFSKPYPISVTIAALFYLMLGLWSVNRVLKSFECSPWIRSLVLIAVLFGTNLFYYTVGEPSMNHVFSFGLISFFFYLISRYFSAPKGKILLVAGIVAGMIMLIRPLNGLIIFSVPFAAGSTEKLMAGIKTAIHQFQWLVPGLLAALGILSIQLVIYKISCGYFMIYSYGNEWFNFLQPHMIDFLVSYKKGFFLYTPLTLLSMGGFIWFWKYHRFRFYTLLLYLILLVFVFSSWWSWWYGGSFSSRIMTDYLIFFAILLAVLLKLAQSRWLKGLFGGLFFILVFFCQVQTFQYRYHKIHWENMDQELYWKSIQQIGQ